MHRPVCWQCAWESTAIAREPLTHSIHEARVVVRTAAEKKVVTQMGTQIHAGENYRRIVELVRSGAIGPVREFHAWLRGRRRVPGIGPARLRPCPPGPRLGRMARPRAAGAPYHPCYVPHDWHYWWDFGGGAYGNMGCHYIDLAYWALKLRHPEWIETSGSPVHAGEHAGPRARPLWVCGPRGHAVV